MSGRVPAPVRAAAEWLRRVEAEYRSSAITQELGLWLTRIAASPDLIRDALRIADDELVHAEMAQEVYAAAGGTSAPRLAREELALPRTSEALEFDVTRACVRVFCLGETVAVPLFRHLREGCTARPARAALDRVLRDEVRHRDFGWDLLHWLLDTELATEIRSLVARELPAMFATFERAYGARSGAAASAFADEDRAWGLAPASEYDAILRQTVLRVWVPRFAEVGIDARAAWDERGAPPPAGR